MAPLPVTSTQRYKYTYQNAIAEHSLMIRLDDTGVLADADYIVGIILTNLGAGCSASTVTAVEVAGAGDTVFEPIAGSTLLGTDFGSGTAIKQYNATAATFVGRAEGGRRARISLFGWKSDLSEFRLTSSESSDVATCIDALNTEGNHVVGINNFPVIWKAYVDIKANDHWVDKSR